MKPPPAPTQRESPRPGAAHAAGIYLGKGRLGPVVSRPEQCCLVLGPPRSGKTSCVVVPNVLSARSGVLVASTKPDVLVATVPARTAIGRCALFDPSGHTRPPEGVELVGWSPLRAAEEWEEAVLVAEAVVGASRPAVRSAESSHWAERAAALLAPLFHAAALDGTPLPQLVAEVHRRQPDRALEVLATAGADLALDVLEGVVATDAREQSGIWSTAAGALAAYRLPAALAAAQRPELPPSELVSGVATLYVVAPSDHQQLAAPVVAGLVRDLRTAAYRGHAAGAHTGALLVLDELANIAPLHDLPSLVAEGASQGLVTLACLQDLSQARQRWGPMADGFLSLFGSKLVLGGIGDTRTLEAISLLAGQVDRPVLSRPSGVAAAWWGRSTPTRSLRREPRLSPDQVAVPPPGMATLVEGGTVSRVGLTPYYVHSPWRELANGTGRTAGGRWRRPHEAVRTLDQRGLDR